MSGARTPGSRLGPAVGAGLGLALLLTGCSTSTAGGPATPTASSGQPGPTATRTPTGTPSAGSTGASPTAGASESAATEPTTTNTLPAPPEPTKAAASTAGSLTAAALPVPAGWHTVVKKGDQEEGYRGNGTWVHARDPRYAATDTISIGCAEITRDDFSDPRSALEGTYQNADDDPGIGLVLGFGTPTAAAHYFRLYTDQVEACTDPDGPMVATVVPSGLGLIDHRTYPGDDQWTEVVKLTGSRVTLIALTDHGHRIDESQATTILKSIS